MPQFGAGCRIALGKRLSSSQIIRQKAMRNVKRQDSTAFALIIYPSFGIQQYAEEVDAPRRGKRLAEARFPSCMMSAGRPVMFLPFAITAVVLARDRSN